MNARTFALALLLGTFVSVGYAQEHDEAWVLRQVGRVKESDTDAWRRIPWTASLLDARRASKQEDHPVFLFTHDGNIDTGRC
jgi:hypothetical protein